MVAQECTPTPRPQRSRTCSAPWPHYVRSLSALFPQCPQSFRSVRSLSAAIPQSFSSDPAVHVPPVFRIGSMTSFGGTSEECANSPR